MCGRFVSSTPPDKLAAYFGATTIAESLLEASYNVAPTNLVPTVTDRDGGRTLDLFRWGLVPFWAKDLKIGNRMINARAETVAEKNAFRSAFRRRRCIIPADAFYEWVRIEGEDRKQPVALTRADGAPFAFAGLWESWRDPEAGDDAAAVRTCTIITGAPNEKVAKIHDRMPVMLPHGVWAAWLDEANEDVAALTSLLTPAPSELISIHAVSTEVNNPRARGEHLLDPIANPALTDAGGRVA